MFIRTHVYYLQGIIVFIQSLIRSHVVSANPCPPISRYAKYTLKELKFIHQIYSESNEPKSYFNATLMKAHFGDVCGIPEHDVTEHETYNDVIADEKAWPWHVSLIETVSAKPRLLCSGTLIARSWVLTVATCVQSRVSTAGTVTIVLGPWRYLGVSNYSTSVQAKGSAKIILHEKFNNYMFVHNVALVKLSSDVVINDYVRPACLPSVSQLFDNDIYCYISGWHLKIPSFAYSRLQQVRVRIMPQGLCVYSGKLEQIFLDGRKMCIDFQDLQLDTCAQVDGDPLSCRIDGTYFIFGILEKHSSKCSSRLLETIDLRVTEYVDWIVTTVASYY